MARGLYWLMNILGAAALVLVIANVVLFTENRALQQQVGERQQFISDTVRVERLNGQLIQVVAETSASTGDGQLRDLLADNGVTFQVNEAAAAAASMTDVAPPMSDAQEEP